MGDRNNKGVSKMSSKVIAIIASALVVVVVASALVVAVDNDDDDDGKVSAGELTDVANAFAEGYSGGFKNNFVIDTDGDTAKAYYFSQNMGKSTEYYVSYTACDSKGDAKGLFEAQKAQFEAKVNAGSAMEGLRYFGYDDIGSFDGGYGYYGVCDLVLGGEKYNFVTLHYSAYSKNVFIDCSLYSDGNLEVAPIAPAVKAMGDALDKPVKTTVKTQANNFAYTCPSDFGEKTFSVTVDGNTAKAAYAVDGGMINEVYVSFTQCGSENEAKELFSAQKSKFEDKVKAGSTMSGLTYKGFDLSSGLDEGYGYYGDTARFVSVHYSAYSKNVFIDAVFFVFGSSWGEHNFPAVVGAIADAADC